MANNHLGEGDANYKANKNLQKQTNLSCCNSDGGFRLSSNPGAGQ